MLTRFVCCTRVRLSLLHSLYFLLIVLVTRVSYSYYSSRCFCSPAVQRCDVDVVRVLLEASPNSSLMMDQNGVSALQFAAESGNVVRACV
jgi:ankyrin repeat protein